MSNIWVNSNELPSARLLYVKHADFKTFTLRIKPPQLLQRLYPLLNQT